MRLKTLYGRVMHICMHSHKFCSLILTWFILDLPKLPVPFLRSWLDPLSEHTRNLFAPGGGGEQGLWKTEKLKLHQLELVRPRKQLMLSLPPFPCVPYFSLSVFLHYNDRCVDKRVAWLRFWSRLIGLLLGRRETREAKDNYCNCLSIKCRAYVSLWSDGWIFLAKCSKLTEFVISNSFVDKV